MRYANELGARTLNDGKLKVAEVVAKTNYISDL
jgi:hypothetical protein